MTATATAPANATATPRVVRAVRARAIGTLGGPTLIQIPGPPGFAIWARLTAIGGVPLAGHQVEIVDPATGDAIGAPVETDEDGRLFARVPERKEYDLRILDDDEGEEAEADDPDGEPLVEEGRAVLFVEVQDRARAPLADEPVKVTTSARTVEARTDAEGRVLLYPKPGACRIEVRGQVLFAHTLFDTEIDPESARPYRLVFPI